MVSEISVDPIQLLLTIIISGGIVAGIFEWIRNVFARRREEYMDLSKTKIEFISKTIPYYGKMVYFFNSFIRHLNKYEESQDETERQDRLKMALFSVCNILNLREDFFQNFGVSQLDNVEAEDIITDRLDKFARTIRIKMTPRIETILRTVLIKEQDRLLPYHEFEENLRYYPILSEFKEKIISHQETVKELRKTSEIFIQVIGLEINHNYRTWYGEEPKLELSVDTKDFLLEKHPNYYRRILSFNNRKLFELSTWKKRPKLPKELSYKEAKKRQYKSFLHNITIILAVIIFIFFLSSVILFF